jgi:beta-lactamase regulating signal transducer with metallopeptidase domain
LIVPFITIHVEKDAPLQTMNEFVFSSTEMGNDVVSQQETLQNSTEKSNLNTKDVLLLVYCLITAFLLIMFARNLFTMYSKIRGKKYISYKSSRLILIEENLTPHSFWNCMFLNKNAFEKEQIEEEILCHELTHIKQHHTIDVLFIELATVFFWFNPFVFLYKRTIKLNHEFLADEGVINKFQNIQSYQYLLIDKTKQLPALAIASQFNFLITKKRLIMITRHTSTKTVILKQCLCIVVFFASILVFTAKEIVAQVIYDTTSTTHNNTAIKKEITNTPLGRLAGGTKEGVSENELTIYRYLTEHIMTLDKTRQGFIKDKMEAIFTKMNLKQQQQQTVIFLRPSPPLPRVVPTEKQFENFKNEKVYGVWINGKRVSNTVLNSYTAKDFSQVFVSKLYGAAKKNKSYSYQVNMMTKDYYQAYYDRTVADKSNTMGFHLERFREK